MVNITVQQFQPSEIIAIFNEILAHQNNQASGKLVCIRGLYLKGNGIAYNGIYFDSLRDENLQVELPIKITDSQRKELTPGNLVDILGTLGRRITPKSEIKLELNVSRIEVVKEQVIDENEVKRIEYRQRKVDEVSDIAFTQQFDVQQMADESTYITANDTNNQVHAATLTFATHNTVGNVAKMPVRIGQAVKSAICCSIFSILFLMVSMHFVSYRPFRSFS